MDKPTEDKAQSIQAEKQNVSNSASSIDRSIKNLSTGAKLTKFKKPDLLQANFAKNNFFGTDFFVFEAKKAFMHL